MLRKRVSSSCSTSDTRRVNLVTHPVIKHEWLKDREVFATSGTYPWSFVTKIFHSDQPSHDDDRERCLQSVYAISAYHHSRCEFSPGTPLSSTNKTDCHEITDILLKVALNTISPTQSVYQRKIIISYEPNNLWWR